MNAGQPRLTQHLRDETKAFAARLRGHLGQKWPGSFDGPLVDDAVELACVRIPTEPTALRVGHFAVESDQLQGFAVQIVDVTRPVRDHDGVICADSIQVFLEQEPILVSFGVVEFESLYPLTRGRTAGAVPECGLDIGNRAPVAVRCHNVAGAAAENVYMRVDEPGQHRSTCHVDDFGRWASDVVHCGVVANGDELTIQNCNRLDAGLCRVDGDDVGVPNYGVGLNRCIFRHDVDSCVSRDFLDENAPTLLFAGN